MRSALVKGTCCLQGPWVLLQKMQYHAIWHSIIGHISPFPEKEGWQSPYAHFSWGGGGGSWEIFEIIAKLISCNVVRGLQRGWSDHVILSIKNKKTNKQTCTTLQVRLSCDLFPWQDSWLITLHSFSHCASVTKTFSGRPSLLGCKSNSWEVWLPWAFTAMNMFLNCQRMTIYGEKKKTRVWDDISLHFLVENWINATI